MFGVRLHEVRIERGYTLEALAEMYNKQYEGSLSKGTLSKYENDRQEPMISVVYNLSEILDVSSDYLLGKRNAKIASNTHDDENNFIYALSAETQTLTDENKAKLLEMAKFFKQQQEKE